jgi:ADP-heptose:LPS heptosyltransferase
VVHPGAGAVAKRWPVEGFRIVADAARGAGTDVAIVLGPAEADDAAYWHALGYRVHAELALRDVCALVGGATSYVGNDSGPSHLAGALGRRGAVLFGPTRPERWRPLGGALLPIRFSGRATADVAREVIAALAPHTSVLP